MLLHLTWRMGSEDNVPLADRRYFGSFYDVALHDLLNIYFFAIALGAGMFIAGLVILFARFAEVRCMNRTRLSLSLGGLAFFSLGAYMLLRFATTPPFTARMSDQLGAANVVDRLHHMAGPDVLFVYIVLAASGLAIFAAGLAILFGRSRLN